MLLHYLAQAEHLQHCSTQLETVLPVRARASTACTATSDVMRGSMAAHLPLPTFYMSSQKQATHEPSGTCAACHEASEILQTCCR